jgi:hypothetical protein
MARARDRELFPFHLSKYSSGSKNLKEDILPSKNSFSLSLSLWGKFCSLEFGDRSFLAELLIETFAKNRIEGKAHPTSLMKRKDNERQPKNTSSLAAAEVGH